MWPMQSEALKVVNRVFRQLFELPGGTANPVLSSSISDGNLGSTTATQAASGRVQPEPMDPDTVCTARRENAGRGHGLLRSGLAKRLHRARCSPLHEHYAGHDSVNGLWRAVDQVNGGPGYTRWDSADPPRPAGKLEILTLLREWTRRRGALMMGNPRASR